MSYLDSLENNLKALESLETGGLDESKRRETDRQNAIAAAPWAEQLKNGPWAPTLIQQSIRAGHSRRMKVHLAWIGTTLRLEARGQYLELRPAPTGVDVVFLYAGQEMKRELVDLTESPQKLVSAWMDILDRQKITDELANPPLTEDD